ncbi:MAG: DUF1902 domain-containing protein [Clostridia bacterium]|nr:DUF1902 domain-containing protein [Clostridia bacterium]
MTCNIELVWDEEAAVWIATSKDVPGLVLESGSFDALLERVKTAVPELISLNGTNAQTLKMSFAARREDRIPVYG